MCVQHGRARSSQRSSWVGGELSMVRSAMLTLQCLAPCHTQKEQQKESDAPPPPAGPTFRAENSHTARHLAEFWMIEPEMAFCNLEGE